MIRNSKKPAFTLAEIIIEMTILGMVAAIVVPTTIRRVIERENKTILRKGMSTYQQAVEKMIVENNIGRNSQRMGK